MLYSAVGKPEYDLAAAVAGEGIRLVVNYLPRVLADPQDAEGREALGLATDLGGYAIMIGGTNGAHLTSFSLVDVLQPRPRLRHAQPLLHGLLRAGDRAAAAPGGRHLSRRGLHSTPTSTGCTGATWGWPWPRR